MSDPMSRFDQLAAEARAEVTPPIEVADRVMRSIVALARPTPRLEDSNWQRDYLYVGFGSVLAASVAFLFLWFGGSPETSLALVQPFVVELP